MQMKINGEFSFFRDCFFHILMVTTARCELSTCFDIDESFELIQIALVCNFTLFIDSMNV